MERLAAAWIVRDEEKSWLKSFESVAPIVGAVAVCDTGSSDNTLAVVRKTLKDWRKPHVVFEHPRSEEWRADPEAFEFDSARNPCIEALESLVVARFGSDVGWWILSLDADEEWDGKGNPLASLKGAEQSMGLVVMRMVSDDDVVRNVFLPERLWKMEKHYRFTNPMHNVVDSPQEERFAARAFVFNHSRVHRNKEERAVRDRQRIGMAERSFLPRIEKNPEDKRSMFYLGMSYKDAGRMEEAVKYLSMYLNIATWNSERYQAMLMLARCLVELGNRDQAMQVCAAATAENWRRAECHCLLGDLAWAGDDDRRAEHHYRVATSLPPPLDPMFVETDCHTWLPWQRLANVYNARKDWPQMMECIATACEKEAPPPERNALVSLRRSLDGPLRIGLFVDREQMDFIQPLLDDWKESGKYAVTKWDPESGEEGMKRLLEQSDVAWFEWAGPLLAKATSFPKVCRIVARVHAYEVYGNMPLTIDWNKVDLRLDTAHHITQVVDQKLRGRPGNMVVVRVPGGVDLRKLEVNLEVKTGDKVCWAGRINPGKNLDWGLHLFAAWRKRRPNLEFHIAGVHQDERYKHYLDNLVRELGLLEAVKWHPWQEDMNAFYADKDYVLCPSLGEATPYALMEGLACGCAPLINSWRGSRDIYPKEWIFTTQEEFLVLAKKARTPEVYRRWVEEHLSHDLMKRRTERALDRPRVHVVGASEQGDTPALEDKLAFAFAANGCDIAPLQFADLIVLTRPDVDWSHSNLGPAAKVLWYWEQIVGEDKHATGRREQLACACQAEDLTIVSHALPVEAYLPVLGRKADALIYCHGAIHPWGPQQVEKTTDIGFWGFMSKRRSDFVNALKEALPECSFMVDTHFDQRKMAREINECRLLLNIHYTDALNTECRAAEVMSCGGVLVTEPFCKGHPFPRDTFCEFPLGDVDACAQVCRTLLANEAARNKIGVDAVRWIWGHMTFPQQTEKLLDLMGF